MTSRRARIVALAGALLAVAGLVLAGCTSGSDGSGSSAATGTTSSAARALDLSALPPCPALRRVAPRADGLPPLRLRCLGAGPAVRLSDLRGTPMVLNVWAAWCPPCAEEIPRFAALHRKAGDKLRFFGVHFKAGRGFGLSAAKDFGLFYPSVQDFDGDKTATELKATAPPQTLFVTADGRIAFHHAGVIESEQQLASLVQRYLGVTV